jgi:hypothetical protein
MKVIGAAGQAQNGKDTISDRAMLRLTQSGQNWKRTAFALKVKQIFCDTFGVDMEFVEKWKVIPEPPPGFDMPVRQALQFIGDGFRKIQPTVWLDQPFRDRSLPLIISDVRYVNEFTRVFTEGGLNILVAKPDRVNYDQNGSEAQIRPYAEWFLEFFKNDPRMLFDLRSFDWKSIRKSHDIPSPPENIELFHVFICNCGSKDDLEKLVDESLMPIIADFNFT